LTKIKVIYNRKESDSMKFAKGMLIGGIIATGVLMMYNEGDMMNMNKKKMMKKGKKFIKKMGNW